MVPIEVQAWWTWMNFSKKTRKRLRIHGAGYCSSALSDISRSVSGGVLAACTQWENICKIIILSRKFHQKTFRKKKKWKGSVLFNTDPHLQWTSTTIVTWLWLCSLNPLFSLCCCEHYVWPPTPTAPCSLWSYGSYGYHPKPVRHITASHMPQPQK